MGGMLRAGEGDARDPALGRGPRAPHDLLPVPPVLHGRRFVVGSGAAGAARGRGDGADGGGAVGDAPTEHRAAGGEAAVRAPTR